MDRFLRPRDREVFSGFTAAEIEKMEKIVKVLGEKPMDTVFYKKVRRSFNYSNNRRGKPCLKWTEVQSWFQNRQQGSQSKDNSRVDSNKSNPDSSTLDKANKYGPMSKVTFTDGSNISNPTNESTLTSKGEKAPALSKLKYEARSLTDGAWYDVEKFVTYRIRNSGETQARVRYVGYESYADEWINLEEIRERSVVVEDAECHLLNVQDHVLCFEENGDLASYYDAHIIEIRRRMHDARGCRCIFWVQYHHNGVEEQVGLSRLCRRPTPQEK